MPKKSSFDVIMSTENKRAMAFSSTLLIGGSQVLSMCIGFIRLKSAAVILGPEGVGHFGIYLSIFNIASSVAAMGIGISGVREIASAIALKDDKVVLIKTNALIKALVLTGSAAGGLFLFLSYPLSVLTFGDASETKNLAFFCLSVPCSAIAAGYIAILQGNAKVIKFAKLGVYNAALSSVATVALFYYIGSESIAITFVFSAAISMIMGRILTKRECVFVKQSYGEAIRVARPMLISGLGFFFCNTLAMVLMYLLRMFIARNESVEELGYYTAAFALSGQVVNLVVNAMGADFYPKLSMASGDSKSICYLINEQISVGLILLMPVLILMLILAKWIIPLFYAYSFLPAVDLFYWLSIGAAIQVVSFPLGYVLRIRESIASYVIWETGLRIAGFLVTLFLLLHNGSLGAAKGFLLANVFYALGMYFCARKYFSFSLTRESLKLMLWMACALVLILFINATHTESSALKHGALSLIFFLCTFFCIKELWYAFSQTTMVCRLRGWFK